MLSAADANELVRQMADELDNFEDIARHFIARPTDAPRLSRFDIAGETFALNGSGGGDHIVFLDFNAHFDLDARVARALEQRRIEVTQSLRRYQRTAGIAIFDVSGHRMTDALLAAMLHGAFLMGALYEVETFGQITKRLVEHLNASCYRSSASNRFVSMMYGEISEDSRFRFVAAGHSLPMVFSARHDRFMNVDASLCVSSPPLGVLATLGEVEVNEWRLMGAGDILVLSTDGLVEHGRRNDAYCPGCLEDTLRRLKCRTAAEILAGVHEDIRAFAPPKDDISVVIIKRTQ
jgi:serine phosphatase RsbU (regulator of sigma subunit)